MWGKDLGRTIDYLETRSEFSNKIAFYGFSWGATLGVLFPAIEERLQVGILVSGGLYMQEALPEAMEITYAPRVKIPVLMLNGRYDGITSLPTLQIPMFEALGTPEEDKLHVLFETGHVVPRNEGIKEILAWLDRYLGPVS
jgi:pimeloyl-ACP methyl ester carboxylesterase